MNNLLKSYLFYGILSPLLSDNFRIVYYHIINDKSSIYYHKPGLGLKDFRRQLRFFKNKYEIISLHEAINRIKSNESLKNTLAITSDDGFIENYTFLAPILSEENIPATFFLVENCIDNNNLMWRNKLTYIQNSLGTIKSKSLMHELAIKENIESPMKNENLLQWSARAWKMCTKDEMSDCLWTMAGLIPLKEFLHTHQPYMTIKHLKYLIENEFSVGSHTKTHPYCNKLNYTELEEEVIGSLHGISSLLEISIKYFAYPFSNRAPKILEQKLINEHKNDVSCILGIKNKNTNSKNPLEWERDNVEFSFTRSILQFTILPYLRKMSFFC